MEGKIEAETHMGEVIASQQFFNKNTYKVTLANMKELFPNHIIVATFKSKM